MHWLISCLVGCQSEGGWQLYGLHSRGSESSHPLLKSLTGRQQRFTRQPTTLHNGTQRKRDEKATGRYSVLHC